MSFLLKTLKHCAAEETGFKCRLYYTRINTYLNQVLQMSQMHRIERSLELKHFILCFILDIEEVLNKTTFECIQTALKQHRMAEQDKCFNHGEL